MSKEAFRNYKNVHNRLAQIDPAVKRMGPIAMAIQYRKIPIDLDRRLRLVHERKLEEENIEDEKRKKEERRAINFGRSQQYVPRTFNDTLNKVALKIQEVSVPRLNVGLRNSLKEEVAEFGGYSLRLLLASLRKDVELSISEVSRRSGVRFQQILRAEKGQGPVNEKIIRGFEIALGLDPRITEQLLLRVDVEKTERRRSFYKKRVKPYPEKDEDTSFGPRLRSLREAAGVSSLLLSSETGIPLQTITQIERGERKIPDELTILKLFHVKLFNIPDSMFPPWFINPSNKAEYLRMVRVRTGFQKTRFANMIGRKTSSIVHTESGKSVPSLETIKLYEKTLRVKIKFPDFANQQSA